MRQGLRLLVLAGLTLAGSGLTARAQQAEGGRGSPAPIMSADEAAALEPAVDVGARSASQTAAPAQAPAPAQPSQPAPPRTAAAAPRALDSLDLGTTSITGNQELPKVLYIVPWKRSDLGGLVGRPVNTLLDEVLAPVDPDVFERQLGYYDALHEESREE
jgi:hypothetical protein